MIISKCLFLLIVLVSISLISATSFSASASQCPKGPADFITRVYTTGNCVIEYQLHPDFKYKKIEIVFFGKEGEVLRHNTVKKLETTEGTFEVPDGALNPPAQVWFNFRIRDTNDCGRWGLVTEKAIWGKGNKIGIDVPTPGKGHAFLLKE